MSYLYVKDHRDYLLREFQNRLQRRPLYSQRAFARDLGLSASTLTDYMKDRLGLSTGRIKQISKNLNLTNEQTHHWIDLTVSRFSRNQVKKIESEVSIRARLRSEKNAISLDEFKVVSEWQHFAFLELIQMNTKKYSDLKLTAVKLGTKLKELKNIVQRLESLNLLKRNEEGFFIVDPETFVGNQAPSEAIRSFHSQILKKSLKALDTDSVDRRYNSSTFISLSSHQLLPMIEHLKKSPTILLDPLKNNVQSTDNTELYCLSIQFFDLLGNRKNHD